MMLCPVRTRGTVITPLLALLSVVLSFSGRMVDGRETRKERFFPFICDAAFLSSSLSSKDFHGPPVTINPFHHFAKTVEKNTSLVRNSSFGLKRIKRHRLNNKITHFGVKGPSLASTAESINTKSITDFECELLSENPQIYIVHNLLSQEECQAFIDRATDLSAEEFGGPSDSDSSTKTSLNRTMTRSNPPEVTLDVKKLWPLPFLSLGAGIPPFVRLVDTTSSFRIPLSMDTILDAILPPIAITIALSASLAVIVTQAVRLIANTSSRTSEAMALNMEEDIPYIRELVNRACIVAQNHPWTAFEAPVITRYLPGAIFARHNDASPTRGSEWADLGGQRVVTVIVYLNTCNHGGGTKFDRLGITVKPRQGSALVFFPADSKTLDVDDRTRHESLSAVEEKWIVQLFGRVGPRVPPPLGIPDSFDG